MTLPFPQCAVCAHFDGTDRTVDRCKAYPGGIPARILDNTLDHRKPLPHDNGVRWAPIEPDIGHPIDLLAEVDE